MAVLRTIDLAVIVFNKAGKPGWGCIVPIFNIMLLCDIAGEPQWWTVLYFIPVANIVVGIIVSLGAAKNFGRSVCFGVGLFFLAPIFYGISAFGASRYSHPSVKQAWITADHCRLQSDAHQHNWGSVAKRLRQELAKLQAVVRVHSPPPIILLARTSPHSPSH